jgi:phospholipid-transporting ATPase
VFLFEICFCLVGAIYSAFWDTLNRQETDAYLHWDLNKSIWDEHWILTFIRQFGAWILIFTNFVPISLLVTLELVKFFQAWFIQEDATIFDIKLDMKT